MAGDADDGALPRRRLVLDGVIADEDVRQRRGAAEQGEHQRKEIELVGELGAPHALERRAAARHQQFAAGRSASG